MFKPWRSDKNKIKVVFKLQFQATQVPKSKKSTLTVSLVPDEVGKATVKLEKAKVEDGSCYWENPVYETVKLHRESKTGVLKEKIYHFIVSAGSSKSGFLGEASIDFADFATETEPTTLALPLKFANSGAILHVTIQKMQDNDQRDGEQVETPVTSEDKSLSKQLSNCSIDDLFDDDLLDDSEQNDQHRSPPVLNFSIPPKPLDATKKTRNMHKRSNTDWSLGSGSDGSLTDAVNNLDELPSRKKLHGASDEIENLKNEISDLRRQSTLSEMEVQSLRKQIVKETKRGQNLSTEVQSLTEERDGLKKDCERLLQYSSRYDEKADSSGKLKLEYEKTRAQLEAAREELDHEKDTNVNLKSQLQKTQDSNTELILAITELDETLKEKDKEISQLLSTIQKYENSKETEYKESLKRNSGEVNMLRRKIADQRGDVEAHAKKKEELEAHLEQLTLDYEILKQENHELSTRLEEQNLQEEVTEAISGSASLSNIKELEGQIENLEGVVKRQAQELSESLITINELQAQVKGLEKELHKQAQGFEEDMEAMTQARIEQEQRAIRAEEALRKTRWKNAVTAERLQEEFRRLSVEMTAKIDENEKQTMKAVGEANELRQHKKNLEETLRKANEQMRQISDENGSKIQDLSNQLSMKVEEIERVRKELDNKSMLLEEAGKKDDTAETHMLKAEIKRLKKEMQHLKEQEEQKGRMKDEVKQNAADLLVKEWNQERDVLEKKFLSAKKDMEEMLRRLMSTQSQKEEKEMMVKNLQSEVRDLMARQDDLKHSLLKEQSQNENLRREVLKLQGELTREPKKDDNGAGFITRSIGKSESKDSLTSIERQAETCTHNGVAISNTCISSDAKTSELIQEMAMVKEKNKMMEKELKEMEERYSEISLRFAEVEIERQQLVMAVRNLKNSKK